MWDFAARFAADVVDDFVAAYAAGQTPNPCLRCNEKIKFAALLDRALALGFDAVCTGHYARLSGGELRRAVDADKDQSYVLSVLGAEQLRHAMFPLGDTVKADIRAEAAARGPAGGRQARQPRHLLHPLRRHPRVPRRADRRAAGRGRRRRPPAPSWAATTACTASPSGSAAASASRAPAADGRPRYVLGIEPVSGTVRVGPATALDVRTIDAERPVWTSGAAPGPFDAVVQVRAHGGLAPARVVPDGARVRAELTEPLRGVAPGQAVAFYVGRPRRRQRDDHNDGLTPRRVAVFRAASSVLTTAEIRARRVSTTGASARATPARCGAGAGGRQRA